MVKTLRWRFVSQPSEGRPMPSTWKAKYIEVYQPKQSTVSSCISLIKKESALQNIKLTLSLIPPKEEKWFSFKKENNFEKLLKKNEEK